MLKAKVIILLAVLLILPLSVGALTAINPATDEKDIIIIRRNRNDVSWI